MRMNISLRWGVTQVCVRVDTASFPVWVIWHILQGSVVVPWRSIVSSVRVWAICIAHFCCMWGMFIMISCLPMYYKEILNFEISNVCHQLYTQFFSHKNAATISKYTNRNRKRKRQPTTLTVTHYLHGNTSVKNSWKLQCVRKKRDKTKFFVVLYKCYQIIFKIASDDRILGSTY